MPNQGRELILAIGGDPRPGEGVKGLLHRVAKTTGVGVPSLEKSWKRQYESKNTVAKLLAKLEQKEADNAKELASRLDKIADDMVGDSPSDVQAFRAVADRLRRLACGAPAEEEEGK